MNNQLGNFIKLIFRAVFAVGLLAIASPVLAQTPDGETPAEETICEGQTGALSGLCNAFCEAMDCNLNEGIHASPKACAKVLDNYLKKSGGENPPCLDSGCAATATAAANEYYAQCITSNGCDSDSHCAGKARSTYKLTLKGCNRDCSSSCRAEYSSCRTTTNTVYATCLAAAGTDTNLILACNAEAKSANVACGAAYTECTTACVGPTEPYVAPSMCP